MENMGDNVAPGLPSDVVVRRTVGMKKDEYLLNNKRAELQDIINLFETIGFSRSNPYNIVLQGHVDALTAMSASERLALIKDIAGATLYDDKKEDSLKLLMDTREKMNKVGEVIQSLQDRIDSLGAEKDELAVFQQLDKRRRALEHRLRDLDLSSVERHLADLELEHAKTVEKSESSYERVSSLEESLESEMSMQRREAIDKEVLERQKAEMSQERSEVVQLIGKLEMELREVKSAWQESQYRRQQRERKYFGGVGAEKVVGAEKGKVSELPYDDDEQEEKEIELALSRLNKEIKEKEKEMSRARREFELAHEEEMRVKSEYEMKERRAKELYEKQGRMARYKTKKERDDALKEEIGKLSRAMSHRRKQTTTIESDIVAYETSVKQLEGVIENRRKREESLMESVRERTSALEAAKKTRDEMSEVRKTQWKEQRALEEQVFRWRGEMQHLKRTLHSTLSRELVSALEAVAAYEPPSAKHQVFGPLVDLIDVEELYMTAVETTAKQALFHIVVDTDETAALLLTHLQHTRAGRITCIPLNKVPPSSSGGRRNVGDGSGGGGVGGVGNGGTGGVVGVGTAATTAATSSSSFVANLDLSGVDAEPLPKRISPTQHVFQPAINQIFGKTLVCADLEVATELSQRFKVSCVTLDGSQVNPKGALSGGYIDEKTSRLRTAAQIRALQTQIRTAEARIAELSSKSDQLEERVTRAIRTMAEVERQRNESLYALDTFALTTRNAHKDLSSTKEALAKRQQANAENEHMIKSLEASIASLEEEIGSALFSKLSDAESRELQDINVQLDKLASTLLQATSARVEKEAALNELDSLLSGNLLPQQVDLESQRTAIKMKPFMVIGTAAGGMGIDISGGAVPTSITTAAAAAAATTTPTMMLMSMHIGAQSLESLERDLESARSKLTSVTQLEENIEQQISTHLQSQIAREDAINAIKEKLDDARKLASDATQRLEKLFNQRTTSLAKRDELLKRIREIGSLPAKESEEVSAFSQARCQRELAETKERLAGFGSVNKKALDQYLSFSEEKEKFSQRKAQMELEHEAIENLMEKLDMQKDEAISRTFRGVAKNFAKVFSEICPDGEATLVMRIKSSATKSIGRNQGGALGDGAGGAGEEEEEAAEDDGNRRQPQQPSPDAYTGIDMKVTFNKASGSFKEGSQIRQLSGGQRTIISLSLIFAIQRCDPAPFYIFDEIDPALDDRYRATIANMIKQQSETMQFLIVTHRPEMVRVAHKNYVVSYSNRISRVTSTDVDTALEVVAKAEKEEEAMATRHQQMEGKRRAPAPSHLQRQAKHASSPTTTTTMTATPPTRTSVRKGKPTTVEEEEERSITEEDIHHDDGDGDGDDDVNGNGDTHHDDDGDDDDELVMRFHHREADQPPNPLSSGLIEQDPMLQPAKSRPKRTRGE